MLSSIFNKNTLKLVLALSILVGLVGLVYFAQTRAEQEMKNFAEEQNQDPDQDAVTIDNYELKEVSDDNELRWRLQAKTGVLDPSTKDVKLTGVEVTYYKEGQVSMRLTAPIGDANELTHVVILSADQKCKVLALGEENGTRLETNKLELTKKNQFLATGGVNIDMPGVAKVKGDTAEGTLANASIEQLHIKGNTHAIVGI